MDEAAPSAPAAAWAPAPDGGGGSHGVDGGGGDGGGDDRDGDDSGGGLIAAPDELSAWLQKLGLARFEAALREEDVGSVLDLHDLNANDWKELGMSKYAVRDVMAALANRVR